MTTYDRLHEIVRPKLVSYVTDLEKHDQAILSRYTGPFLYGYRPTGTSLLQLGRSLTEQPGGSRRSS